MSEANPLNIENISPEYQGIINQLLIPDPQHSHPTLIREIIAKVPNRLNIELLEHLQRHCRTDNALIGQGIHSKQYQDYLWILAYLNLEDLPKRGEGINYLIDLLRKGKTAGNDLQKAKAKAVIKELKNKNRGDKINKVWFEQTLEDLRQLGMPHPVEATPSTAAEKVRDKILTFGTHAQAEKVLEQKQSKFTPEILDPKLNLEIQNLEREQIALQQQWIEADKAGNTLERNRLERRINKLEARLEPLHQKEIDYYTRISKQLKAIEDCSNEMGFTLNADTIITTKEGDIIEITQLKFDRDRPMVYDDGPGALLIQYKMNGKKVEALYAHFRSVMRAARAFQKIEGVDELTKYLRYNNGHIPVQVGQIFHAKDLPPLTVTTLDEAKRTITTDPAISYFAGVGEKEVSFGQFATFLISHGYKRQITAAEVPEIIEKNNAETIAKIQSFTPADRKKAEIFNAINNFSHEEKLKIPKSIGEKSKVYLLQDNNMVSQGELTLTADGDYQFIKVSFDPKDQNILRQLGVPERVLARKQDRPNTKNPNLQLKLSPIELIDKAKSGFICAVPQAVSDFLEPVISLDKGNQRSASMHLRDGTKQDIDIASIDPSASKDQEQLSDGKDKEDDENPEQKVKINIEALPYDKVFRNKPPIVEEQVGYLKSLYAETRFFSIMDIAVAGKTMWEYYERRFNTRQKQKYSGVLKDLKYFGADMQRINQNAETEEMDQFKGALDNFGFMQTRDRLRTTNSYYELKACFVSLVGRGQLRWDDVKMWKNVNRFAPAGKKIPIPYDGKPHTIVKMEGKRGLTGFDFLKPTIDAMWGDGQFDDWMNHNKSAYASGVNRAADGEGKSLEGQPGGFGARLANLLMLHKQGEPVDPQRYEGLLMASINMGKGTMQDKLYYMIQGVACVNSKGNTILDFDRIGHINAEYLTRYPFLDYICTEVPRPPDGKKSYRFTLEDYKSWAKLFDQGLENNVRPTTAVDEFMWRHALTSDQTIRRINKVRDYQGFDPDDTFAFFPPMNTQLITDACNVGSVSGGKKATSLEAFKNIFPGFSQYLKTLTQKGDVSRLTEGINSFIRFESIMTNRYEKDNTLYQRMEDFDLKGGSVCSSTSGYTLISQINLLIDHVVAAYVSSGIPGARAVAEKLSLARTQVSSEEFITPQGKAKQDQVNAALKSFPKLFTEMIEKDKGKLLIAAASEIEGSGILEGMPYEGPEEQEMRKQALEKANA